MCTDSESVKKWCILNVDWSIGSCGVSAFPLEHFEMPDWLYDTPVNNVIKTNVPMFMSCRRFCVRFIVYFQELFIKLLFK